MDLDFSFLLLSFAFWFSCAFGAFALAPPPSLLFWCSWVVLGGGLCYLVPGFFFCLVGVFFVLFLCCFGWLVLLGGVLLVCVGVGCVFVFFLFWKRPPCVRSVFGWLCFVWFTFVCCSCSPAFGRVRLGCFLGGLSLSPFLLGILSPGPPLLCCLLVPLSPFVFGPGRPGRRRVVLSSVRLWLPLSCRLFSTRLVLGRTNLGCFVVSLGTPRRLCLLGSLCSSRRLVFGVFVSPRRVRVRVAPPWSVAVCRPPRFVLLVSSLVCSLQLLRLVRRWPVFVLLFGCLVLVFLLWLSPHLVLRLLRFVLFSCLCVFSFSWVVAPFGTTCGFCPFVLSPLYGFLVVFPTHFVFSC